MPKANHIPDGTEPGRGAILYANVLRFVRAPWVIRG